MLGFVDIRSKHPGSFLTKRVRVVYRDSLVRYCGGNTSECSTVPTLEIEVRPTNLLRRGYKGMDTLMAHVHKTCFDML